MLQKPMMKLYAQFVQHFNKNIALRMQFRALDQTCEYVERHMADIPSMSSKQQLTDFVLNEVKQPGLFLEFGVFQGNTINYIAGKISQQIHGFDSFEGLPEFWRDGYGKGTFKVNRLPDVRENVTLHKGWFEETLPGFLQNEKGNTAFIHVDCDLYSSTKTIFSFLEDRIKPGTVILFDEYFNFPGWQNGEYLAFKEYLQKSGRSYKYLAYNRRHEQVAVIIT